VSTHLGMAKIQWDARSATNCLRRESSMLQTLVNAICSANRYAPGWIIFQDDTF
jgi:hypothetical protein